MSNKRQWMAGLALLFGMSEASCQLVINEIMQSNIDCIMDDLNDFPDSWVELYNTGNASINLSNYRLGLANDASTAYQLPNQNVAAHGFALIFCDKVGNGSHTNFRLDAGNGSLYLFKGEQITDRLDNIAKQPAPNIAYGRKTNGDSSWGYLLTPTPNDSNCGQFSNGLLGEPVFSEEGQVVTDRHTISLSLSVPDGSPDGTQIRYTTNGSEPTASSTLYSTPINISSTRTIRAKLFCNGYLSPRAQTHSYVYFLDRSLTLPVVSLVTDNKYMNDSKIGIYVTGNYSNSKKNYQQNWRRPINIEYFESSGQPSVINQLCETRILGNASREAKFKSLVIYAHKRFGKKRLDYEFFPEQRPGITSFKSVILRNAGNDFDYLYMRDAIIQRTMATYADIDWQAWQPVIIYINGVYKGILNVRERSNEDNIYTNYDGLEDIDMVENWNELKQGDLDNFNRFKEFYEQKGHTMAEYDQWMDCSEYINIMAMNLFYNNLDFPGNNFMMWRPRTEDGRWRFVAKDTDFGIGLYDAPANYNTMAWLYNHNYDSSHNWANSAEQTLLFRNMMEDPDFQRAFIDRCAVYMGDFLNEKGTRAVWDPMYEQIKLEYPNHRKLINQWWPNYNTELSNARNWLSKRPNYFYTQLANQYNLGTPTTLFINNQLSEEELQSVSIAFNGITLSKGSFNGKFFADRDITLKGTPMDGKTVNGWKVRKVNTNGSMSEKTINSSEYSFTMPACNNLIIEAIIGNYNGIDEQQEERQWHWTIDSNRLLVKNVAAGKQVRLLDIQGRQLYSTLSDGSILSIPIPSASVLLLRVDGETISIAVN